MFLGILDCGICDDCCSKQLKLTPAPPSRPLFCATSSLLSDNPVKFGLDFEPLVRIKQTGMPYPCNGHKLEFLNGDSDFIPLAAQIAGFGYLRDGVEVVHVVLAFCSLSFLRAVLSPSRYILCCRNCAFACAGRPARAYCFDSCRASSAQILLHSATVAQSWLSFIILFS